VYEQRKSFELRPDQGLLFRRYKSYHPDEILAAVLVQQLPVPLVHLQVLVEVLEDDHAVAALVQVGQHREALPGHFHFILDPGVDEQLGDVPAQLRVHRFDENENFGVASQSRFGFVVVVLRYSGAVHDAASYVRLGAVASLYETREIRGRMTDVLRVEDDEEDADEDDGHHAFLEGGRFVDAVAALAEAAQDLVHDSNLRDPQKRSAVFSHHRLVNI
jgi:hypothetical protein